MGGQYVVSFVLGCQAGQPSNACISSRRITFTMVFSTEDYCNMPVPFVAAAGTLWTYSDASYSSQTSVFLQGDVVYNQIQGYSKQATITSMIIANISLELAQPGVDDLVLFVNGATTSDGRVCKTVVNNSNVVGIASIARFSFVLDANLIPVERKHMHSLMIKADVFVALDGVTPTLLSQTWQWGSSFGNGGRWALPHSVNGDNKAVSVPAAPLYLGGSDIQPLPPVPNPNPGPNPNPTPDSVGSSTGKSNSNSHPNVAFSTAIVSSWALGLPLFLFLVVFF